MEILRWILIGLSLPVIGWLVIRTKRNASELNQRIDEYHKEQEELERQRGRKGPINPYEQMANLFSETTEEDNKDK